MSMILYLYFDNDVCNVSIKATNLIVSFVLCIMICKSQRQCFRIVLSQIDVTCACCKFGECCLGSRVNDLVSLLCNERNYRCESSHLWPLLNSPTSAKLSKELLVGFNIEDCISCRSTNLLFYKRENPWFCLCVSFLISIIAVLQVQAITDGSLCDNEIRRRIGMTKTYTN